MKAKMAWMLSVCVCRCSNSDAVATGDSAVDSSVLATDSSVVNTKDSSVVTTADSSVNSYDPCPASPAPCAVMPLGDSITWGVGSSTGGGYRVPLFHLANQNNQAITFVGTGQSGPGMVDGKTFPQSNEGHSGYTIDDGGGRTGITNLVVDAMTKTKPNIVTLMIGTNDVNIQLDLANAGTRLGILIDKILATDPKVLLIVAQIVPTQGTGSDALTMTYNATIPGLVSDRAKAGKHITMVDMYSAFKADAKYANDLFSDGLHPNDAGYVVMANTWYAVLGPLLK